VSNAACRFGILEKRLQPVGADGQAGARLEQIVAQLSRRGQARAARFLGRHAGQVIRRTVESTDDVRVHQRPQRQAGLLRASQCRLQVGPGNDHQIAHVGGSQIGP
jgi:hypothetical protein